MTKVIILLSIRILKLESSLYTSTLLDSEELLQYRRG